jgi:FG-GAP-like repeat/FG-GAP repeat
MRPRLFAALVCAALALPALVYAAPASAAPHFLAGDFDGDGHRDLAIGAPGHNRVRVAYTHSGTVTFLHPNATSTISMQFGTALAVGDFNGDGYSDLAVGAPDFLPPGQTGGFGNPETEGAVFEFRGSSTGLHARILQLTGPYDGDEPYNLGAALAAADVTGDGRTDLAATLYGADLGNIRVFRGGATGLTTTNEQFLNDFQASSLAFGDINGDHHPDLIAGAPVNLTADEGDIRIFRGRVGGTLTATPNVIRGNQVGVQDSFGYSVATGDINNDGYADVVVGSQLDKDATSKVTGSIVALTGSSTGLAASRHQRFTETRVYGTTHALDHFGAAVTIATVSSDGYADVIVGAPGVPVAGHADAGAVYLLRGTASGLTLNHRQRLTENTTGVPGTPETHGHFGAALWAAQLVGTANPDVVIGAPNASHGAAHGGLVVRLRGGSAGLTTTNAAIIGDGLASDHLGTAIR